MAAKGTPPTTSQADNIVLASAPPGVQMTSTLGNLFANMNARAIFRDQVVKNARAHSFIMAPEKVPMGDTNTLDDVSTALVQNAATKPEQTAGASDAGF